MDIVLIFKCFFFSDDEDAKLFKSVFLAKGRGRRPSLPSLGMLVTNRQLLQLYFIKQSSGSSWDNLLQWLSSLFPHYPRTKTQYLVERAVQGILKCQPADRQSFLNRTLDLDSIGVYFLKIFKKAKQKYFCFQ